nr:DNA/RNA non-specific endonuclease [Thiomicrorhabdus aquaedulcis]
MKTTRRRSSARSNINARTLGQWLVPMMSWIKRRPQFALLIIVLGGAWYAYETQIARPNMAYMGVPKMHAGHAANSWSHVIRNDGFMLGYSEKLANPLWVTYKVGEPIYKAGKRPSRFESDWRSPSSIAHDDYTGSGFDRGHMAPNHLIATRYGVNAQSQTF